MKKTKVLFLIVGFLLVVGLLFIIVLAKLVKQNSQCFNNPFTYAADRVIDYSGNKVDAMCSCGAEGHSFWFDNESIYKNNPLLPPITDLGKGKSQKFNITLPISS